jgi:hypothetical protein
MIAHPVTGFRNLTGQEMRLRMMELHGTTTPADVSEWLAQLLSPFSGSLRDHVGSHRRLHQELAAAGAPLSEHDKIQKFILSISNAPPGYHERIVFWEYSTMAMDTRTFDNPTTIGLPNLPGIAPILLEYDSARVPLIVDYVSAAPLAAAAVKVDRGKPIRSMPTPAVHYCWTHGPNATHTSPNCLHKQAGHADTASFVDNMGGRKEPWVQRPKKAKGT